MMAQDGLDSRTYDNQRELKDNTKMLVLESVSLPLDTVVFSLLASKGVDFFEKCVGSIQKHDYASAAMSALYCIGDAYAAFWAARVFVKDYKSLKSLLEKRQALKEEHKKLKMLDMDFDLARDSRAVK